jgi:hypothetical protein
MCWPHRRRRRSADEPVRRGDADTEQPQPPCGGGREGCRLSRRGPSTRRRRRVRSERGRRRRLVEGDRLGTPKAVREPGGRGGHAVRLRSPRRLRPFTLRRRIHLSNSGSGGRDLSRSRLTAMSGPDPGAIQRSTTKLRSGVLPLPAEAAPTSRPGLWAVVVPVGMSPSDDIAAEVERLRSGGLTFRNDIMSGPGGQQILLEDPSGNPIEALPAGGRIAPGVRTDDRSRRGTARSPAGQSASADAGLRSATTGILAWCFVSAPVMSKQTDPNRRGSNSNAAPRRQGHPR